MLRRLHHEQPDSFAFTPDNLAWAEGQISKYPEGRQASAIIPLLWRAQEQEGWLTRPAIEHVADMLGMAYIRALEVASFYFMFQLQPVGSVAHIQICGTTSCMICGAEDLMAVCKDKIAARPHDLSADGKFSWEEVECLGSCANAPMAQIGKDYYEDLTAARLGEIIDELAAGKVPTPGPQNGRYASEPLNGLTSLKEYDSGRTQYNASVQLAVDIGDTVKRIDGTEVPLLTPWRDNAANTTTKPAARPDSASEPKPAAQVPVDGTGVTKQEAQEQSKARPVSKRHPVVQPGTIRPSAELPGQAELAARKGQWTYQPGAKPAVAATQETDAEEGRKPRLLKAARDGKPDDLKLIKGVGPKLESVLHDVGIFHFDQIAAWTADEVVWADQNLVGFKGRVSRDNWVEQARTLAEGGETEFSARVKDGDVY
ncbi:NADH-quinone oxidoreductase subunit E [Sedimentitalea sp. JM2-8]|uniref:NADH-quinone oxidoreductase subunit E n=1 Tax=Sedimentitalea xiamensis TaxID=3050037 RepID=A0ABT7FBP9_9RHOB|nr:NADH-quinone oxidoreductase subunit E [Sedimentitalea xiamensis]MDK3072380.1 NADH-quinone oxidoreductase subunit E [Sedimentitalea xiamensis]